MMKSQFIFIIILLIITSNVCQQYAQSSALVYLSGGKLNYTFYANTGETNAENVVPDFSFAGYKKGGVKLPHYTTTCTLYPQQGDMRNRIQAVIDSISLLPINEEGIRGVIELKNGRYEIGGEIYIKADGIILRGEGQNIAENGGTELMATALRQHSLINIKGTKIIVDEGNSDSSPWKFLDKISYPDSVDKWAVYNVFEGAVSEYNGDKIITLLLTSDSGTYTQFSSKEGTNPPVLRLKTTVNGVDSTYELLATDDAFVQGGTKSDTNFGIDPLLRVKSQPDNLEYHREIYLKFDLTSIQGEIISSELNLFARTDNISEVQHSVFYTKFDQWEEETLTYNNRNDGIPDPNQPVQITSLFVGTGANSFTVQTPELFGVGDKIIVERTPNQFWVESIGMIFNSSEDDDWTPENFIVANEREITVIKGDTIYIDIPLVDPIENRFGGGQIYKNIYDGRVKECGIENLFISSVYQSDTDENHGWVAVELNYTENCWVKNVTAEHFGYSCVDITNYSKFNTIEECANLDPKSVIDGSRRYSFEIDKGTGNLINRCYGSKGRHDFITGSRVAGPNVFLDCVAENTYNDIGPHFHWATGTLFDNIYGGEMRVWDRGTMGNGHGWSGNQTMFWNSKSTSGEFRIDSPPGGKNWAIGCEGITKTGAGYWESWKENVAPRSLYLQQLKDRLGDKAVRNILLPDYSAEESYWQLLLNWKGIGELSSANNLEMEDIIPSDYKLFQNYPNPFNPTTKITFFLPSGGKIKMKIVNLLGEKVCDIFNDQFISAGLKEVEFNASNMPSGVYFCLMELENIFRVNKMVLIK